MIAELDVMLSVAALQASVMLLEFVTVALERPEKVGAFGSGAEESEELPRSVHPPWLEKAIAASTATAPIDRTRHRIPHLRGRGASLEPIIYAYRERPPLAIAETSIGYADLGTPVVIKLEESILNVGMKAP